MNNCHYPHSSIGLKPTVSPTRHFLSLYLTMIRYLQLFEVEANTINMQECSMLISRDWLYQVNPDIQWNTMHWHYWKASSTKIKIHHAMHFSKITHGQKAHLLLISTLLKEPSNEMVPSKYCDHADVFSATEASKFSSTQVTHIDLFSGKKLLWKPSYPMLAIVLEMLQNYLHKKQAKGWIHPSTSSAGAPVIFIKKADSSSHLCIDYCSLNEITKKNWYLLPCIDELMDWVAGATLFTKLDLCDTYHCIRICREDG